MGFDMDVKSILNNYFDKIYVITLERSSNRHEYIENSLSGLNYEFFYGVDGSQLTIDDLIKKNIYDSDEAKRLRHDHNNLTLREIGCALSHLNLYKHITGNRIKRTLILEDDVYLNSETEMNLEKAFQLLPENWELLYLGYLHNDKYIGAALSVWLRVFVGYPILYMIDKKRYNPIHYRNKYPRSYNRYFDLSGSHYGTHAYAVTESGAARILKYQTPIKQASDHALGRLCRTNSIKSFNIKEKIFFQNRHTLNSTIKIKTWPDSRIQSFKTENL